MFFVVMSFLLDALAGTTPSNELVGVETAVGTDLDVGVTVSTVPSGPLPSSSSASVLLNNSSTGVVVVLCNCFFLSLVASSKILRISHLPYLTRSLLISVIIVYVLIVWECYV